jgi:hypothetical protein
MFTIKLMHDNGHTAISCAAYKVITEDYKTHILPFKEGEIGASMDEALFVASVAYVENANGKTIDRIHACPVPPKMDSVGGVSQIR